MLPEHRRGRSTVDRIGAIVAIGLLSVTMTVAVTALVFRGPLEVDLGRGLALSFAGAFVLGVFVALRSRLPGHLAGPQDATAVLLGLVAFDLANRGAGTDTVITFVLLATLASSLLLGAIGLVGAGSVARVVPVPVTGGFIAGTGIVMLMSTADIVRPDVGGWFDIDALAVWVPTVVLGVLLAVAMRSSRSRAVVVPVLLVSGVLVFHLARAAAGVAAADAERRGWMLPDLDRLEPRIEVLSAFSADWGTIGRHLPELIALLVLVAVSQLFRFSSIELETRRDLDVDHELRTLGGGGLLSVPIGGLPGYTILSQTLALQRMVGPDRVVAVSVAVIPAVVLAVGGAFVGAVPVMVPAAVLVMLGLGFVLDWTWAVRHRLPPIDLAMLALIAVAIAALGFLAGVTVGLMVAVVLFVVRYSRVDVVRRRLSGAARRSTVQRNALDEAMLVEHAAGIEVIELQGYLFFGSAAWLERPLRDRDADRTLRVVVLDMRRVTGLDTSALVAFERLVRLAAELDLEVMIGGHRPELVATLTRLADRSGGRVRLEVDIDRALEMAEESVLARVANTGQTPATLAVVTDELAGLFRQVDAERISAGTQLLRLGDPHEAIFLLEEGEVTISVDGIGGAAVRLRRLGAPAVLGEIGYYLDVPASATVVAHSECQVRRLDAARLAELVDEDPMFPARLHQAFARSLADRLRHASEVIRQLAD